MALNVVGELAGHASAARGHAVVEPLALCVRVKARVLAREVQVVVELFGCLLLQSVQQIFKNKF